LGIPNNKNFGQAKNFPLNFIQQKIKKTILSQDYPLKGDSPDKGLEG